MKFSNAILGLAAIAHGINAVAVPDTQAVSTDTRTPEQDFEARSDPDTLQDLYKRKGGGGGGRGGGGGGGGSSGGGSGGGRGGGGGGGGGGGRGGGGIIGQRPTFGGGRFYGGGASQPYRAGGRSPSGIAPALLTGAALGGVAFLGVAALSSAWSYPYHYPYYYHNATTDMNETKPVTCLCDPNSPCGCDDNGNQTFFNEIIGNGTYQGLNQSVVTVAKNETTGEDTIFLNGILPNGTEVDSASGRSLVDLAQAAGWWPAATMLFALAVVL
ncbi:hypothetical protein F5Y17DRAFT_362712 [Xylariaceae sp. FL0594]|nr:hypothetical protein F5Y17DRAFT_362712 [Xylariaceae sp. FL0594]